jgi:hypothetical protein
MYCNPFFHRRKEFFCHFRSFFQQRIKETEGGEEEPAEKGGPGGELLRQPTSRPPERRQVEEPAQQHPQQHEQAQAAPAGDAAQEIEQHRRQKGIGKIKEDLQLFQPETAQEGRQELIEKAQGPAAGQAHQGLQALIAGIDAHQPRSFPRKPRRCSRSCA